MVFMNAQIIWAVALSAFVWPGAGQIYNKEFKKGLVLVVLTFVLSFSFIIGAEVQIMQRLQPGFDWQDWRKLMNIINELRKENTQYVTTFNFLMMAAWVYSTVDAWLGAREILKQKTQE